MEDLGRLKLLEYQIRLFQDGNQFFENTFKSNTLVIGRDDDCDLIIQDKSISRKHLRIDIDIDKFYVTDMGSSNGTFVDNEKIEGRVRVNTETHIRAGKITIQVVTPEVKKVELDVKLAAKGYTKSNEEASEITLSKIAIHVEELLEKTSNTEDVMAMIDKDFIDELTKNHQNNDKFISKKIESLVLWNKTIFHMQEFGHQDTIVVGPTYTDSIHIPSVPFRWSLSTYEINEAVFSVPRNLNVFAIRGNKFLSKEQLVSEKRIREDKNSIQIQISHYDVLRVEIDENTQLYFRYVPSTVELESKKFMNPDELMKKAILTSFVLNLTLALIFFLIPKGDLTTEQKPKEPERVAKLIVEEKPPVVVPPPEIPPPLPPEPPPPPPEEVKPPEPKPEPPKPEPPPKVEPPKPKPKPKKEPPAPPPKKVEKAPPPKPVQKATEVVSKPVAPAVKPQPAQNPQGNNKPAAPAPVVKPQPPAPPPPKPVDISKLGALAAISGMKLDARSTKTAPQNINIAQNTANTNTGAEVGMNSMTSDLKNQAAEAAQSNASKASGPIKTKGTGSVGTGFGTSGLGTGTGQRGVKGAVVGKPQLSSGNGRTEGLSREQVLKAMQPYLGKIQSCYERSMLSDPNLAGRIDFEWTIAPAGAVKNVQIKKNSVAGGEQLGECVVGVIRSIKFPTATNGEETSPAIGFPFGRL